MRAGAVRLGHLALAALVVAPLAGATGTVRAQTPVLTPDLPDVSSRPAPSQITVYADRPNQELRLPVGKSVVVDLQPSDAAEVLIGNPKIADAVVRTSRRFFLMAVEEGQTTVTALDKAGRQIASLQLVIVSRDLSDLKRILDSAIPENDIHVKGIRDSVILTGTVASALDAQKAADIATAYVSYSEYGSAGGTSGGGGNSVSFGNSGIVNGRLINTLTIRGQDQVMLKVQVVEVRRDIIKQLGVNLNGDWTAWGRAAASSLFTAAVPGAGALNVLGSTGGDGVSTTSTLTDGRNSLSSTIQAFERHGVAHVLAEPNVTAVSGETAKFEAGGTVPVPSQSSVDPTTLACTTIYQQQPYGISLNFTPTVLSEGRIALHMETEVDEPDNSNQIVTRCGTYIGFRKRKNSTTLELPSGGSIASAGLVQRTSQQVLSGTPGLMNLPVLGALFRSRDYQRQESELMIVVTPYLVKPLRPDQISRPDDGFTDASDPQAWLLGRMNKIYSAADNPELVRRYRGRVGFIAD